MKGFDSSELLAQWIDESISKGTTFVAAARLMEFPWVQAQVDAGLVCHLPSAYERLHAAGTRHPRANLLPWLARAIGREAPFIERHPHLLLQTLWHLCFWHDSPAAAEHYQREGSSDVDNPVHPWNHTGPKLYLLMEEWRDEWFKQSREKPEAHPWLRSTRPAGVRLASPLSTDGVNSDDWGTQLQSVTLAPNGRQVAARRRNGTWGVWSMETGMQIIAGECRSGADIAYSKDSQYVANVSADFTCHLWHTGTGVQIASHRQPGAGCVAISGDGSQVAIGCEDGGVYVWSVATGDVIVLIRGWDSGVDKLAFDDDGELLKVQFIDGTIRCWVSKTGFDACPTKGNAHSWATWVSTDTNTLVRKRLDRLLGADAAEHLRRIGHVVLPPQGSHIITWLERDIGRAWSRETGELCSFFLQATDEVVRVGATPDGTRIYTVSRDRMARIWDTKDGGLVAAFEIGEGESERLEITADGSRAYSYGGEHGGVRIWDAGSGTPIKAILVTPWNEERVLVAKAIPTSSTVVCGLANGEIHLLDTETLDVTRIVTPTDPRWGHVHDIVVSPDGSRLLGVYCGFVLIVDLKDGEKEIIIDSPGRIDNADVFAENNCGLPKAVFSLDGAWVLARFRTSELYQSISEQEYLDWGAFYPVYFSTIKICDARTGKEAGELRAKLDEERYGSAAYRHNIESGPLRVTDDGSKLYIGNETWDLHTLQPVLDQLETPALGDQAASQTSEMPLSAGALYWPGSSVKRCGTGEFALAFVDDWVWDSELCRDDPDCEPFLISWPQDLITCRVERALETIIVGP